MAMTVFDKKVQAYASNGYTDAELTEIGEAAESLVRAAQNPVAKAAVLQDIIEKRVEPKAIHKDMASAAKMDIARLGESIFAPGKRMAEFAHFTASGEQTPDAHAEMVDAAKIIIRESSNPVNAAIECARVLKANAKDSSPNEIASLTLSLPSEGLRVEMERMQKSFAVGNIAPSEMKQMLGLAKVRIQGAEYPSYAANTYEEFFPENISDLRHTANKTEQSRAAKVVGILKAWIEKNRAHLPAELRDIDSKSLKVSQFVEGSTYITFAMKDGSRPSYEEPAAKKLQSLMAAYKHLNVVLIGEPVG